MGTFLNSEDPDEMLHNAAFHATLFVKVKKIFRQKIQYLKTNYILTPLDMYNGLSQVYCIKPEESIIIQRVNVIFILYFENII